MNKKTPKVSIVFPNYNGGNEPLYCLQSIQKLNYPKNKIEVIIFDNASTDGSCQRIQKKFPWVKIIYSSENKGFSYAINHAASRATGEILFIGNDDLVFEKNSLRILIEYYQKNPKIGILGGKIFYKSHPRIVASSGFFFNFWTGNIYKNPQFESPTEPDWIQGCAICISKKLFMNIGGFDAGFSLIFFEDIDICMRVKKAGKTIQYVPNALFWHGESMTMNKKLPHKYYQWYKNKLRFILKIMPIKNAISILLLQFFVITPFHFIKRDGRTLPFFQGVWWNLGHLPETLQARRIHNRL